MRGPPALMPRPIVEHVAALAEGREAGVPVVGGIVVPMGGSQHHPCRPHGSKHVVGTDRDAGDPARSIAPGSRLSVPPAPVAEMADSLTVRASAGLTAASSALKADKRRELRPVVRVEVVMLAPDRHACKWPRLAGSGKPSADPRGSRLEICPARPRLTLGWRPWHGAACQATMTKAKASNAVPAAPSIRLRSRKSIS